MVATTNPVTTTPHNVASTQMAANQSGNVSSYLGSTTNYAANYIVADAVATRSSYASETASLASEKSDSSSLFATMILAQMKTNDLPSATSLGTSAYKQKTTTSLFASVA